MPYVQVLGTGFESEKYLDLNGTEGYIGSSIADFKVPEFESAINLRPRINPFVNFDRYYSVYLQYEKDVEYHYVFFVRPQLNIVEGIPAPPPSMNFSSSSGMYRMSTPKLTSQAENNPTISWIANSHGEVVYNLIKGGFNHHFMAYLTGRVEQISVPDFAISTYAVAQPVTGYTLPLAGNAIESLSNGGEFSVTFRDDAYHRIEKTFRIWIEYMHCMSLGLMDPIRHEDSPNNGPVANNYVDYMGSTYNVCTRADGSEIVWIDKFTGILPTEIPDSNMSFNRGGQTESQITIPFKYFHHRACDNAIIMDFNYNAGGGRPITGGRVATTYPIFNPYLRYNVGEDVAGNGMVTHPYIRYDRNQQKYFLEWIY